jgi:putative flavoprotein involved in K+ transport
MSVQRIGRRPRALVEVAVVGAGPAGLALSDELVGGGIGHVVLERGRVGESWRTQRWDSFRLNSQVWANRVPGDVLAAPPDRFPSAQELVAGLERLAAGLPVTEGVEVLRAERLGAHWRMDTSEGPLLAEDVVVASGFQNVPRRPAFASALPDDVTQLHVADYRRAGDLDDGVLVVGGGQSGVQVTADLLEGGRRVYLSTSQIGRMPRRHRGRDAWAWLRDSGQLDLPREQAGPAELGGTLPQISGAVDGRSISYQQLARDGATLLGQALGCDGRSIRLRPDVGENIRYADRVSQFFHAAWDAHAGVVDGEPPWQDDPADAPAPGLYDVVGPESLDVAAAGISTVVWATGFDASLDWLPNGSLDRHGRSTRTGLHVVGAPWLTHRASNSLYGIPTDARRLARDLALSRRRAA